jgi:hypothetical protein
MDLGRNQPKNVHERVTTMVLPALLQENHCEI